jgi:hypothetical protein
MNAVEDSRELADYRAFFSGFHADEYAYLAERLVPRRGHVGMPSSPATAVGHERRHAAAAEGSTSHDHRTR